MKTGHAKERIRLGGDADTDCGCIGLVIDLGFPVIHIVLFGNGKVGLNTAF